MTYGAIQSAHAAGARECGAMLAGYRSTAPRQHRRPWRVVLRQAHAAALAYLGSRYRQEADAYERGWLETYRGAEATPLGRRNG